MNKVKAVLIIQGGTKKSNDGELNVLYRDKEFDVYVIKYDNRLKKPENVFNTLIHEFVHFIAHNLLGVPFNSKESETAIEEGISEFTDKYFTYLKQKEE